MPTTRRQFLHTTSATLAACAYGSRMLAADAKIADVCIYGATASGIAAALGAADTGAKVIVVEPSRWLGGMSGGGLNAIDWGNKRSVGKMAMKLLIEKDPIRVEKPDDYDPRTYEIFRRGFQKGVNMRAGRKMHVLGEFSDNPGSGIFGGNSSRALWAQSVAGANTAYPEGDWATRSRVWRDEMNFVRGMYHFLRTDPSAPVDLREKAESIGFQRGIFDETGGWPHQLYVREARRMKSDYVVTQKDLEGEANPDDSVGLSAGIAAAHAIKELAAVQAIDFPRFRRALLDAGQVLELNELNETGWNSRDEWNQAKRGYEWVFDAIDEDKDGRISPTEYREFQAFKQKHADWHQLLKATIGGK